MLGANVFVIETLRFLVSQLHYLASAISKSFVHVFISSPRSFPVR